MDSPPIQLLDVTAVNVTQVGVYCIKDKKAPGYLDKVRWFQNRLNKGLKLKLAIDETGKQIGFIEYIPSELAWRPIKAKNYLFIQCIAIFGKETRDKGYASQLIKACEHDAIEQLKSGVCTMTSDGPWVATKSLFEKNNYAIVDRLDRFELLSKSFKESTVHPRLNDWTKQQPKYEGWHLIYADQCPWHAKAVAEIQHLALTKEIPLQVTKLSTPSQAQNAPSGFGTFSLIKDGTLLADHYISKTRFENILRQISMP